LSVGLYVKGVGKANSSAPPAQITASQHRRICPVVRKAIYLARAAWQHTKAYRVWLGYCIHRTVQGSVGKAQRVCALRWCRL